jgi:hypothetical protein
MAVGARQKAGNRWAERCKVAPPATFAAEKNRIGQRKKRIGSRMVDVTVLSARIVSKNNLLNSKKLILLLCCWIMFNKT